MLEEFNFNRSLSSYPMNKINATASRKISTLNTLHIATPAKLVMYVMYGAILTMGIAGNMGILYTFAKRKQRLKSYDIYVVSLVIADLLSAIFLPMVSVQDYLTNGNGWHLLGVFGCKVFVPMNHLTMMVSTYMMVIIAVSRLR